MVTLRVQSLDDIITAYCRSLGFEGKSLQAAVKVIGSRFGDKLNHEDVIASLDKMLLDAVKKYLPDNKLGNDQKTALFKAVFLLQNGAKKWGCVVFEDKEFPADLQKALAGHKLMAAPEFKVSHMQPQKIEASNPLNAFRKIGDFFHKG